MPPFDLRASAGTLFTLTSAQPLPPPYREWRGGGTSATPSLLPDGYAAAQRRRLADVAELSNHHPSTAIGTGFLLDQSADLTLNLTELKL